MRTKEEIVAAFGAEYGGLGATRGQNKLILELLLDIRSLLQDRK